MHYEQWLDEWLESNVKPTSKMRTYEIYVRLITYHIKPNLGEYKLNQLTPMVLQSFVTKLLKSGNLVTGKGLASNTVNCIITVMQSSLKYAYDVGLVKEYVANKIKRPRKNEKEITCFNLIEQKKIERFIVERGKTKLFGVFLCLYSGMRLGEILALKWCDIDLSNGTIHVSKSCHDGKDAYGKYMQLIQLTI